MSNARAVAAVTASLRSLLEKSVMQRLEGLSGLEVTTKPLDVAHKDVTKAQINAFLYQTVVSPHGATWICRGRCVREKWRRRR